MKINLSSIEDVKESFKILTTSFSNYNYMINIEAKKFSYDIKDTNCIFNIDNLRQLKSHENIIGKINKSSFEHFTKSLENAVSFYASDASKKVLKMSHHDVIYFRTHAFLVLIKQILCDRVSTVFEHIPEQDSLFNLGNIWQFCHVFLENGNGLLLSSGAFDQNSQ